MVRAAEARGNARREALKTKADAEAYVKSVQERIRECFGPMPEKTPLNAVQGYLGLLQQRLRAGHVQEAMVHAQRMAAAARRMTATVKAIPPAPMRCCAAATRCRKNSANSREHFAAACEDLMTRLFFCAAIPLSDPYQGGLA